jgi:SAM-dependent methyltransferase
MSPAHWTETLFLRHPEVFLAVHEKAWPAGEAQAKDTQRILDRFGVPAGGRILDAPCGIGRHGTRLARMGYRVLGVDLSPVFVERARDRAKQEGVADRATYRVGDLRALSEIARPSEGMFDAALNLWTSLGYYDEDTDVRILQEYAKLVRPGGVLVVYIVNRDFVVRHFDPQGYEAFGDIVHIEQRHLDLATSRMENQWRFFRRDGNDLDHILTVPIGHRIYSLHDLRRLLERGGWHVGDAFGGFKMDAPSIDSPTQLVVGRR